MTIEEFKSEENIAMLLEIIWDINNDKDKNNNYNYNKDNVKPDFLFKVGKFIEIMALQKNHNIDTLTLNKIFITNYIASLENISNQAPQKQFQNTNNKETGPELITFEEIQNSKRSTFEKELKLKQIDFENSMSNPVPSAPNFKVSDLDKPIGEMDTLIAKTLAQRNYDIEQIHNQHMNQKDAEKWLHPQETSVKSEKMPIMAGPSKPVNSIGENSSIDKHVTWKENLTFDIQEIHSEGNTNISNQFNNVFSKLKMKTNDQLSEEDIGKTQTQTQQNDSTKIKKLQEDVVSINQKLDNIMTVLQKLSQDIARDKAENKDKAEDKAEDKK